MPLSYETTSTRDLAGPEMPFYYTIINHAEVLFFLGWVVEERNQTVTILTVNNEKNNDQVELTCHAILVDSRSILGFVM